MDQCSLSAIGNLKDLKATITKAQVRQKVWEFMEKNDIANFPRPVYRRIPNFKGAPVAGQRLAALPEFVAAKTISVCPDKPQEEVRYQVLEYNKDLIVPTPGLAKGLFNRLFADPEDRSKERLRLLASRQGIDELSKQVPMASRLKIDLVVVGSVAVDVTGRRIGKGEGFTDLEFAMGASHHSAIGPDTIVVTTVHDVQVFEKELLPENLFGSHDLPVDLIVTPTRTIRVHPRLPKPICIDWSILTREKFERIPVLKEIQFKEKKSGKDVRLKDDFCDGSNVVSESSKQVVKKKAKNDGGLTGQSPHLALAKVDDEHKQHQSDKQEEMTSKKKKHFQQKNSKKAEEKSTSLNTLGFFLGRIPRNARVKDLKDALADRNVKVANLVWKGPKGYAFVDLELETDCNEVSMCAKLNELQIGEVVLNVELDRRQMLVKPQQGPSRQRDVTHKPSSSGRKWKKVGNGSRESTENTSSETIAEKVSVSQCKATVEDFMKTETSDVA